MRTHARWLAPLFAASLLLAACGDDDTASTTDTTESSGVTVAPGDSTDTTGGDSTATTDEYGSSDTTGGDTVVAEKGVVLLAEAGDLGEVLVNDAGLTLYTYANDAKDGPATCVDACAGGWPGYINDSGSAGEGVTAEVGTVANADGTNQVTVNGWPVYTFAGDGGPGEANGQGTGGVWYVLGADGKTIGAAAAGDTTATTAATTETTADSGY